MAATTISSREFNQDTGRAKRAALNGPVLVTDRGRPTHVLLTIEAYERLTGKQPSLVEALGLPEGVEDVELEIAPRSELARAADFR